MGRSPVRDRWFDHCDISDGSDGNLDITNGSDLVTVSWTQFHYSTKRTESRRSITKSSGKCQGR
jgi:pectate lyase